MKKYKIDDLFVVIRNGANIKQDPNADGIPITRIETTSNDKFNRNKVGFANIYDSQPYKNFVLQDQDLLMSHINSEKYLGRCVLYNKEDNECIIHGMNLLMLRANNNLINPRYINLYFKSARFRLNIAKITKKSVNQASFNVNSLKNIEVNIPELSEQGKIADKFDKLFALIEQNKTLLAKYDELVKSQFIEMFGDIQNKIKIQETCDIVGGYAFKSSDVQKHGLKLLQISNVYSKEIDWGTTNYLPEDFGIKYKDFLLKNNDIVIALTRPIIQSINSVKMGIITNNDLPCLLNQRVCKLTNYKENINENYLYFCLEDNDFLHYVQEHCTGSSQPNISTKDIANYQIKYPPIELQNQFADFVKHIDKLKFCKIITNLKNICYNVFDYKYINFQREVKNV